MTTPTKKTRAKRSKIVPEIHAVPEPVKEILPPPPSPFVLALQEQVVELINQRSAALATVAAANAAYLRAGADFKSTQERLQQIESEVQYRLGIIGQMENRPEARANPLYAAPVSAPSLYPQAEPMFYNAPPTMSGIGSLPAQRTSFSSAPQDPIRSESAEEERRAL